ncbi:MAG: hypothetical protein WC708_13275 [Lentisphaeria bacterium]
MKCSLKYTFLSALVIIGVLYWTLAIISGWLICDDSKAVNNFMHEHLILTMLPCAIWVADSFGGRYIVTIILIVVGWWVVKQKSYGPHA